MAFREAADQATASSLSPNGGEGVMGAEKIYRSAKTTIAATQNPPRNDEL
jgi:hypothetical protein